MNGSLECLNSFPSPPPTASLICAIPFGRNLSSILSSCCHGAPIATYGDIHRNSSTCYQYCNITSSDYNSSTVMDCLSSSPGMVDIGVVCGPGLYSTSIASTHITTKWAWLILGLVVAGVMTWSNLDFVGLSRYERIMGKGKIIVCLWVWVFWRLVTYHKI